MDMLNTLFSEADLYALELWIGDWSFVIALVVFGLELLRLAIKKMLSWNILGDAVTNFITLAAFVAINIVVLLSAYLLIYFYVYEHFSITQLPNTGWTLLGCLLLADMAYYWEHRFTHRVNVAWSTHTVHHSSPHFNISVAYRFGPLDGFFPIFFHLPLVMLGFHPFMVFLCEAIVQIYQTLLHTEAVGKFPRPIEAVMNTPSHHRVHHGSNRQYIDKNYAGILIIWDRMFGTFAREEEKVRYGVLPPINSINPIKVFCHGYWKLFQQLGKSRSVSDFMGYLFKPPGWQPADVIAAKQAAKKAAAEKATA